MEIFKLFGTIMVDNTKANESISKTEEHADTLGTKLGTGIKTAAKWGVAIGAAATAVGGALFAVTTKAAETGDRVDKLSQKIGLSRESFQEWDYVLAQNGIDVEKLQTGIKTMTDAMGGVGQGAKAFDALGISITDSSGAMRSQEDVFAEAVNKLQEMEDQTMKASIATDLFGRAGTELMPLLNQTAEGTDELIQRAHDLGLVMSDEAVDASVKFGDTLDDVKKSLGMIGTEIGVALMPVFQKLLDWVIKHLPEIKSVFKTAFDLIGSVVKSVANVVESMLPIIKPIWEFIEWAVPKAAEVIEASFGAIAEVVGAVADAFEWLSDKVEKAVDWLFAWNKTDIKDKNVSVQMDGYQMVGKSHAGGLPYVPYDGYIAELHRGEKVLTAMQSQEAKEQPRQEIKQFNFNITSVLNGREVGKAVYQFIEDQNGLRGPSLMEG